ncbi:MAG: alpha/beta hydrolase [Spirochaetia bacterium]|nr:alpha/beta hydrolase [Spirochaetia bacterium]
MKRKLTWTVLILGAALGGGLWYYSGQLLFPAWRAKDLSVCDERTVKYWGPNCGNLRMNQEFKFQEVQIPSINGYNMAGWLITTAENGRGQARGAVFYAHGGGSDRREGSRYVKLLLDNHFDVLLFDMGCSVETPCPVPGMTFGHRESRDVTSAYLYLSQKYKTVVPMGTSVGATSILIALPTLRDAAGIIAENPMFSFRRFVLETPASPSIVPQWFKGLVIRLALRRGRFDGLANAETSVRIVKGPPIFFLHSKKDMLIPYQHTEELSALYTGPKKVWITEEGEHASLWNADATAFDKQISDFLTTLR